MGEGGVSKWLPIGTNCLTVGTLKALNIGLRLRLLALPGKWRGLLFPHTGALQRKGEVKLCDQNPCQNCGLESWERGRGANVEVLRTVPELHQRQGGWGSRRRGGSRGHSYSIWCRQLGPRGWRIRWRGNTWGLDRAQAPLQAKVWFGTVLREELSGKEWL